MADAKKELKGLEALAQIIKTKHKTPDIIVDNLPFRQSKQKQRGAIKQWIQKGFVGVGADEAWLKAVIGLTQPYVEKLALQKGFELLDKYTNYADKHLHFRCLKCNEVYETSLCCIARNSSGSCSKCFGKNRTDYYTFEKVKRKLKKWGFKLLIKKDEYRGLRDKENGGKDIKYPIKCLCCNREYKSVLRTKMRGIKCRFCAQFKGHSKFESVIEQVIHINFLRLAFIKGSRDVIPPYELDFYIPSLNLAFEYNGEYWHSDKMIKARSKGKFETAESYHNMKTQRCKELGIDLIHLWESDGMYNRDIVFNNINKRIGGLI